MLLIAVLKYIFILAPLHLAHENLADTEPVIIPFKIVNILFTALYGIITGSLPADYLCVKFKP